MNIISKTEEKGRLEDGIQTMLSLSDEEFKKVLDELEATSEKLLKIGFYYTTDEAECKENIEQIGYEHQYENGEYIARGYFGVKKYTIQELYEKLSEKLDNLPEESKEYNRIEELLEKRNIKSFKEMYSKQKNVDINTLNKVQEVLEKQEKVEEFIKNEDIQIKEVLGNLYKEREILENDFYIPNLEKYQSNYKKIVEKVNMEKYINPKFTFEILEKQNEKVLKIEEYNVDEKIIQQITEKMPEYLSLEEKIIYIYGNACKLLNYEEKEILEFLKIVVKTIDTLNANIKTVIIKTTRNYAIGLYTDKISIRLEPVKKESSNDLINAKSGIRLEGIIIISDKEKKIKEAIESVYIELFANTKNETEIFVKELKKYKRPEITIEQVEKNNEIQNFDMLQIRAMNDIYTNRRNIIIAKILKDDACFFKLEKDDAILILQDIGIPNDKIENVYKELTSSYKYYYLQEEGKLDEKEPGLKIKYKSQEELNKQPKEETAIAVIKKENIFTRIINKIKAIFVRS